MDIIQVKNPLASFLKQKIDPTTLYDPQNNPFVRISFVYIEDNIEKEEGFSTFLRPNKGLHSSTYSFTDCLSQASKMQAKHLNICDEEIVPLKTDYGFSSSFFLEEETLVIISVVASPQDTEYVYTMVKNQTQILSKIAQ